ncbi:3-hydroxyacyl-CoA dehydrogenase family protein [Roseovarius aestuarii]|nr:3-hydroxyacyl-CoA dehydrogenase family protein [Roseovarius aestuarii]
MTDTTARKIAVIGNGLMGAGIAQIFAAAGDEVVIIGRNADSLQAAREKIAQGLTEFAAHDLLPGGSVERALARVTTSTGIADAANASFVVEAVIEDAALKNDIFGQLDAICAPSCILASSSGRPASSLIEQVKTPERVIAAHFWFPAPMIPVVEVCPGPQTSRDVVDRTMAILRSVGKEPVEVTKELPGMIGNRIQFAILREAWALWASGAASAEAIVTVVKKTLGRRLGITGPLESAELGGLDTLHAFAQSLLPHIDADQVPAAEVSALVADGARGFANQRGTHDWSNRDGAALLDARRDELFRWLAKDRTEG